MITRIAYEEKVKKPMERNSSVKNYNAGVDECT